ncbi:MAG: sugar ABC transporter permease [Chloroflexota bacterium]
MTQDVLQSPRPVADTPRRILPNVLFGQGSFKYWALAPLVIVLAVLTVLPILQLLRMSVSDIQFVEGQLEWEYVGLEYFEDLRADPIAMIAIRNTLTYVFFAVLIETVLGFLLAFAVSRTRALAVLYRSVVIIPLLIPPVAIGTMWSLIYDYNYGLISTVLFSLGVANPPLWTADPDLALLSVIIVDVWHWTSFMFLIMLAGIESLPVSLVEAARVDGATERQILQKVILPLMAPTILIAMMLRTILAFKVFDQIFVLTSGGPGTATQVISMHIYKVFSEQFRLGYASFLSLLVTMIMTVFVVFYLWANSRVRSRLS